MDIGGGLAIDSDPIGFLVTKPTTAINSFLKPNHPKWKFEIMESSSTDQLSAIQFPVNIFNRRDDDHVAPAPSDQKRVVVDEMDFFSDKNRSQDLDSKPAFTDVKKEDVNTGLNLLITNTGSDQSTMEDDGISPNVEDKQSNKSELGFLQAELNRMNAENQRLKGMLNQVNTNYNTLQMHLVTVMQQQEQNRIAERTQELELEEKKQEGFVVPRQFMDLGRAATAETTDEPSQSSSEGRTHDRSGSPHTNPEVVSKDHNKNDFGAESPDRASQQGWVPNKVPKLGADQSTEATMRKARVSVRARSEAPMISDGCQWRKYGQKMAKGNPCPRGYYRCTMAAGCPVRKQVQRCAEDKSILITTYDGNHNHPLPPAAMAMASTTSAAACMLLSGSTSSADGLMNSNFLARNLLPYSSSMATISASAPFPTITLDLTNSPNPLQFQRPPTQFHIPFPNPPQNLVSAPAPPQLPQIFGQALYNQSKFSGLHISQDVEHAQLAHQAPPPSPPLQHGQQPSLADTVSAATAAITADPNFTAALAAAITSIIGGAQPNNNNSSTTNSNNNANNTHKIIDSSFQGN